MASTQRRRPQPNRLLDIPDEVLIKAILPLDFASLQSLALTCQKFHQICNGSIWPIKVARKARVASVKGDPIRGWMHYFRTMEHSSSRDGGACNLYIQHEIGRQDTLQGLCIRYDVDSDILCRCNALLNGDLLRHRGQVFVPVVEHQEVTKYERKEAELVHDSHSNREYLVIDRVRVDPSTRENQVSREQRVRDMIVRLLSRGLNVDESEARYYLEDADMDVVAACRNLQLDRKWSASSM